MNRPIALVLLLALLAPACSTSGNGQSLTVYSGRAEDLNQWLHESLRLS